MFTNILVPVDGSPPSDKALDEAVALARQTAGQLHLLHVVEEMRYVNGFEPARVYLEDVVPYMAKTAEKLIGACLQKAALGGVPAEGTWVMGDMKRVSEHVNEHARHVGADLIVVGSHGRRGASRLFLGSDAEQIVRHAPVPVLVVRQPASGMPASGAAPASASM